MESPRRDRKSEILDKAERLFREKGYTAVSLTDLARAAGIRKPSIYHHFPGGKEELFVLVQLRMCERVGTELRRVLASTAPIIADQLHAAAHWFLSQPPMFILSMIHNDMEEMSPCSSPIRLCTAPDSVPMISVVWSPVPLTCCSSAFCRVKGVRIVSVVEQHTRYRTLIDYSVPICFWKSYP